MRIFLIWASKDKEIVALMQALDRSPHQLLYWLGYEGMEAFNRPGTIFHSRPDAAAGRPAQDVDTSSFVPPGADIINALYKAESSILTMMNRNFDEKCVDERRHIYYQLLQYWLGVFKTYRPEAIIFPVEPHAPHDYLIYELAKVFSVKTLFFNETRVSDRLLSVNDYSEGGRFLLQEMEKNKACTFTLEDLSPDIQEYYKRCVVTERNATPSYVDFLQNKYSLTRRLSLSKIKKSVREGTFFRKTYQFLFKKENAEFVMRSLATFSHTFRPNLKKEYKRLQEPPDMQKTFIYAPLQVQPERSTSPMGEMFVDQILMLETLSASIPDDWLIYVKEHPMQWIRIGVAYSGSRYRGYYERIRRIPKVRLVPIATNSFALMDAAKATVTVAGAPGWEARLRGKPAIVFGYPWYKDCPGVFRVTDVASCRHALSVLTSDAKVEQQAVINYLGSFDHATIHGYIAESNKKASVLDRRENMQGITAMIMRELDTEAKNKVR